MRARWQVAQRPDGPGQPLTIVDPTGSAGGRTVCVIPGNLTPGPFDGDLVRRTDSVDVANARLIARAPELSDVLASLLEWESQTGGWEAPCWRRARALMSTLQTPKLGRDRTEHTTHHNDGDTRENP